MNATYLRGRGQSRGSAEGLHFSAFHFNNIAVKETVTTIALVYCHGQSTQQVSKLLFRFSHRWFS